MTVVRIDARRLTDAAGLHAALAEAFGFPATYGRNLDALVDCLTHLDDPAANVSRVHVFRGGLVLIALDHAAGRPAAVSVQVSALDEAVAFVNWRRLEKGQPPVVALAYAGK
jgi:hypothetical protein